MKAQDIMTRNPASASPDTSIRDVAKIMSTRGISGMPVLANDGTLVGIISQSDFLHRAEIGTERKRKGWLAFFADPNTLAREYTKSHATRTGDVMTRRVISVRPDADLSDVAAAMDAHSIKRVTVVDGGKLVGVITRGDLVRAVCNAEVRPAADITDQAALHKRIVETMKSLQWIDTSFVSVSVADGVVEVWGLIDSADQREALRVALSTVEGVRDVRSELRVGRLNMHGI